MSKDVKDRPASMRVAMLSSQLEAFKAECARESKSMTETINNWITYWLVEKAREKEVAK